MKTQNYFSQKDIKINNITRIDNPCYSPDGKTLVSRPVICIFYPDGQLFSVMSLSLFRIHKKLGLPIMSNRQIKGFYCELRQII